MLESTHRLSENAKIVLEVSCGLRKAEGLLILTRRSGTKYFGADKMVLYTRALASAAADIGVRATVLDISDFLAAPAGTGDAAPIRAAIGAADVVLNMMDDIAFGRLLGLKENDDEFLTAKGRRVFLQGNGMEEWDLKRPDVAAIRPRTLRLIELLRNARTVRVTSPAGTDFSFAMGEGSACTPILGIVPLYGEVATAPRQGSENGVIIVDGPTQQKVRPASELDRPPLRIMVEGGRAKDYSGDPAQVERLRAYIASGTPPADAIDEVGILTTTIPENDRFWWSDGTHHTRRIHIALGNNAQRASRVHGPRHMDTEVDRPTLIIDGKEVLRGGEFVWGE